MASSAMEPREVERNIRALQKAVIEKEPASVAINILEILKRDVFPTEELLRTTKAGIIISKLKANPNKDIARIAAEIVSKWKRTIQSRPKVSAAAKVMSPAPSNEPKAFRGDSSKRRWENEKVDVKRTGQQTRDACIGLLYNGLCFMSDESSNNIITKALEIEKAAFEHFRGDNAEYRAKLRSLFQNLKAVSNRELGRKVMSGEITPSKFIIMSHDELKSSHRREEDEKIHKENMKKAQVPMAEKSISDALRCGKCGQKKVSYSQAQTRSADEPMTTFCECTICGNRWKFS